MAHCTLESGHLLHESSYLIITASFSNSGTGSSCHHSHMRGLGRGFRFCRVRRQLTLNAIHAAHGSFRSHLTYPMSTQDMRWHFMFTNLSRVAKIALQNRELWAGHV